MKAVEIHQLTGPDSATRIVDAPSPGASHPLTPGSGVLIDVHAAGVAFPELLQTRGMYQVKPELPFIPGGEVAGVVRALTPGGAGGGRLEVGQRVMAFCGLGGFAEQALAPAHLTFVLPDPLDFAQGAGFVLNYHTAHFALARRARLKPGESVLVHGAAGGLGTAALQVARGLGARTLAVVSSEHKAEVARAAGAEQVLLSTEPWKDRARELTGGVDVVFDLVGGGLFLDSLRVLAPEGRLLVVGFAGGSIPEVKVNRLLLTNTDVVGVGWGAFAMGQPQLCEETGAALERMVADGIVRPIVGERFGIDQVPGALKLLDERRATGKVVLELT